MTREELVAEAERLVHLTLHGHHVSDDQARLLVRAAQVYATLALVEATRPGTLEEKA